MISNEDVDKKLQTESVEMTLVEEVELMSACGNTNTEMAAILQLSTKQFLSQALSEGTEISDAILRGRLRSEITITSQLKNLAESGNITSVQLFEKRLKAKKLQSLKEKIYFGK